MDKISEFIKNDLFAKYLGVNYISYGEGKAKAELIINENHKNSFGTVHGGVIYGLADSVFAVASNSRESNAVAIDVSISYFKAVSNGKLVAVANEVSITKKLATYLIHIYDDQENLIALFKGTVYRISDNKK